MKISNFVITGDTHGEFSRFEKLNAAIPQGETWGVIILGDAGFNFFLSKSERKKNIQLAHRYPNLCFYCVRGNHEQRPELFDTVCAHYDENVSGVVLYDPALPHIRYLRDGGVYNFQGNQTLVIGGAYSVDKEYRLARAAAGGYGGWFEGEQLTQFEMKLIETKVKGRNFDLVLSHTCPWSWQPRDLFLSFLDQSSVDNTMELWLDQLKEKFNWKVWLFGHYHDDRIVQPKVEMLSFNIKELQTIMDYWCDDTPT